MNVVILLPKGFTNLSSFFTVQNVFLELGSYWKQREVKESLQIRIIGKHNHRFHGGAVQVNISDNLETAFKPELIVIPGISEKLYESISMNRELIYWVRKQYLDHGVKVCSLCTGTFLLAATGLLDGKQCAVHWAYQQQLKSLYPRVNIDSDKTVVESSNLFTGLGGVSAYSTLLSALTDLVEERDLEYLSNYFQIEPALSQTQFKPPLHVIHHQDILITEIQEYIGSQYVKDISVDSISQQFEISRRSLVRRFNKATGNSPSFFIQVTRIDVAKKLLKTGDLSVAEITHKVGYKDEKSFRNVFKKLTGLTPSGFRQKHGPHKGELKGVKISMNN